MGLWWRKGPSKLKLNCSGLYHPSSNQAVMSRGWTNLLLCMALNFIDKQSSRYRVFLHFWRKENGQKCLQSQTDASRKRPVKPGLTHHEKTDASLYACFGAKRFFFLQNSLKILPMKEMHLIVLITVHVKNWPQRSKRFNQLLKSKIQLLTALADRLSYRPKFMQFRVSVHYTPLPLFPSG